MVVTGMNGRAAIALTACAIGLLWWPVNALGGAALVTIEFDDENEFSPRTASYALLEGNFYFEWGDVGDGGNSLRRHNFVQDDRLFRSGDPTKTGGNLALSVSAGKFDYYCQVHGGPGREGMSGRVQVKPIRGPAFPDGIPVDWALDGSETGNRYDVRFKVDNGDWRPWKNGAAARDDVFGAGGDPVNYNATREYRVQARSTVASDPGRRSGWSPTLRFP